MRVRRHAGRRAPRCVQSQTHPTFCPDSPRPLQCDPNEVRFDSPLRPQDRHSKQIIEMIQTEARVGQRNTSTLFTSRQTPRGNSVDSRSKNTLCPTCARVKTPARAKSIRGERSGRSHEKRASDETSRPRRPKSARNIARSLPAVRSATDSEKPVQAQRSKRESKSTENIKDSNAEPTETIETASPPDNAESPSTEIEAKESPEPKTEEVATPANHEPTFNQKRLYSTVLSTGPPLHISAPVAVKIQGLVKLTSKLAFPSISRKVPQVDSKYEELEREALEQYKPSDESIDSKFKALEKQAMDQYSGTSHSNTSCSSCQSSGHCTGGHCSGGGKGEKMCGEQCETSAGGEQSSAQCTGAQCENGKCNEVKPQCTESADTNKTTCSTVMEEKIPQKYPVESMTIHSQNFPELTSACASSTVDLKNERVPLRGEKKDCHRAGKSARLKPQRTSSDTDEAGRRGPLRWTLYVMPSRKRNDRSSDDEDLKDLKLAAHAAGDHDAIGKTSNC